MRSVRLLAPVGLVLMLVSLAAPARAAALEDHGWWWRAQQGMPLAMPAPPDVPDGGLAVGAAPDGPTEVSAVRYVLREDEREPTLVLTVAEERGQPELEACGSASRWAGEQAGRWDARPTCVEDGPTVAGERAGDGSIWRFNLTPLLQDRVLDVVLRPAGGGPARVTFEPPEDGSLQTTRHGGDVEAPPVEEFDPGAEGSGSDEPASSSAPPATAFEPAPRSGNAQPPAIGSATDQDPPGRQVPAPQVAPTHPGAAQVPQPAAPSTAPAAAPPIVGVDPVWIAALLLGMVAAVGYDLYRRDAPPPRRLGGSAARRRGPGEPAATEVRGYGRFARPRTEPAPPLL